MTLNSAVAKGAAMPPPSSPALLAQGEGGKLRLPGGDATDLSPAGSGGEGMRLIRRGVASDFEVVTEESRVTLGPLPLTLETLINNER